MNGKSLYDSFNYCTMGAHWVDKEVRICHGSMVRRKPRQGAKK